MRLTVLAACVSVVASFTGTAATSPGISEPASSSILEPDPPLIKRQGISTLNQVLECFPDGLPGVDQIPVLYIPMATDPNTQASIPLDKPDWEMWHALRMTDWLQAVLDGCPAARRPVCNPGQASQTVCRWPRVMAALLVGRLNQTDGSRTIANLDCNHVSCNWHGYSDSQRGPMRGPNDAFSLKLNASPDEILEYRRWYAFLALQAVQIRFNSMRGVISQATLTTGFNLATITSALTRFADIPAPPTFAWTDLLQFVGILADFVPGARQFKAILSAAEKISKIPGATFLGIDAQAAFITLGLSKDSDDKVLAKVLKVATTTSSIVRNAVGYDKPGYDPDKPVVTAARMQDFFADFFTATMRNLATQTDDAIFGDPMAETGYFSLVSTGMYSEGYEVPLQTELQAQAEEYSEYLKEKVALKIFEMYEIFLYKQFMTSRDACLANFVPRGYGQECVQEDGRWFLYMPLTRQALDTQAPMGRYSRRYEGFQSGNLATVNRDFNMRSLYNRSNTCYQHTNQPYINSNGYVCHFNETRIDVQAWPAAERSVMDDNPRNAICHINIPVLDSTSPAVQATNRARWFSHQHIRFFNPSWRFRVVALGRPGQNVIERAERINEGQHNPPIAFFRNAGNLLGGRAFNAATWLFYNGQPAETRCSRLDLGRMAERLVQRGPIGDSDHWDGRHI